VGRLVASGQVERGVVACGTGVGIAIAANKVHGVRAGVANDVGMLADRLHRATRWLGVDPESEGLPIGYFGASTGAAAALAASVRNPQSVKAIVSRGGRPDLAGPALAQVTAPTLLVVGALDDLVVPLNAKALSDLGSSTKEMRIVEGATHLFEEPGKLEIVADHALAWFGEHLR